MNRLALVFALAVCATASVALADAPTNFAPDTAFATGGLAIVDFNDADALWNEPVHAVQADDGSYWLLGFARPDSGNDNFAISHLLADGSPDLDFGPNGQRIVASGGVQIVDAAMDGGNFYVGAIVRGSGADFMVECFAPDLSPCSGFGQVGQAIVPFDQGGPNDDILHRMLIRDGSIYLLGDIDTPAADGTWNVAMGVAKIDLASGELDGAFGNVDGLGGRSVFNIDLVPDGADYNADFAFSADGTRLIVGGSAQASDPFSGVALQDAIVLGVDPVSGHLDATFGDAGMRDIPYAPGDSIGQFLAAALTVRHNGRIVFAGDYWEDENGTVDPQVTLIELMPDGSLAQDFGVAGVANSFPTYNTLVIGVTERPGLGDLVVTLQSDGVVPDNELSHQETLLDFSPDGRLMRSGYYSIIPSNAIDTGAFSHPIGVLVDAQNRSLMWGWRDWQFLNHPPYIHDRDMTLSRFVDTDAIFANGMGGAYAD
jgi:hypothetical protein